MKPSLRGRGVSGARQCTRRPAARSEARTAQRQVTPAPPDGPRSRGRWPPGRLRSHGPERRTMKKRAFGSLVATVLGATLVIASIGSGAASASTRVEQQAPARGGTLRVDSRSDFDYVDPALAYFTHS